MNEQKKERLKVAKEKLAQKQQDIRTLAPLVEQGIFFFRNLWASPHEWLDYNKAKALTTEAVNLSQQILDARLAISRLRQTHPHPRLTIASANAQLDSQVAQMVEFDEKVQDVNQRLASVKEKVKESAREVERLRVERAEVERLRAEAGEAEVEDSRVVDLYGW